MGSNIGVKHIELPILKSNHLKYKDLINYIFGLRRNDFSATKVDLTDMTLASEKLGNPHKEFKTVHVTGSNGKGSVSWKIANVLQSCGLKVGLYTSPHLFSYRERFRINKEPASEAEIENLFNDLLAVIQPDQNNLGFFDITTLGAFEYFKRKHVDIAVIEVGIGGRLDSSNIITPELSIITSVGLEHTSILGSTVEEIAREKGGIIKKGCPVVIGPNVPQSVISEIAESKKSSLCRVESVGNNNYEIENQKIVQASFNILKDRLSLTLPSESCIEETPLCRFEVFTKDSLQKLNSSFELLPNEIIFDVGHNPPAIASLMSRLNASYKDRLVRPIIGMSTDKDIDQCLQIIKPYAREVHLVSADYYRLASVDELRNKCSLQGISCVSNPDLKLNLSYAFEQAYKYNDVLVVCGSFFIMKDIRKAIGILDPSDG
jgi:dihydrofolate synthase/folylpolyglutamate synthase